MAASSITNEIIISAMDRFVWFVLLVVMSHLVTEFTRVTGYARGNRHDVVLINDTTLQPKTVSNMIFYPGEEYGVYEQQMSQYSNFYPINNNNKYSSNNNYNNYNSNPNMQPISASNGESAANSFPFSFRPLIDSIFEIPISTLRAVNNLVARLTGSYQHQVPSMTAGVLKSTNANESPDALEAYRSLQAAPSAAAAATTATNTPPPTSFNSHPATTQNDDKTSNLDNKDGNRVIRLQRRSLLREVNA
ncbi:probable serine/threonine-protein kinase MARK-A isoform X2 [Anastrepha ludens]|uniref:probable serine/threonine-protein kinase MARK-A isoform X2 n=1 Tax=Anastrepha ludens TaxID=28586 RepID=UPI0023B15314|nr:probable serine/threonine-protein kinase MARK-A isoform X2 [Anastrepha ludens]